MSDWFNRSDNAAVTNDIHLYFLWSTCAAKNKRGPGYAFSIQLG